MPGPIPEITMFRFSLVMGLNAKGDSFFTLVRLLLIFYCDENGSLNEIFGLELNVWT